MRTLLPGDNVRALFKVDGKTVAVDCSIAKVCKKTIRIEYFDGASITQRLVPHGAVFYNQNGSAAQKG